jgi:hypothetical protein
LLVLSMVRCGVPVAAIEIVARNAPLKLAATMGEF